MGRPITPYTPPRTFLITEEHPLVVGDRVTLGRWLNKSRPNAEYLVVQVPKTEVGSIIVKGTRSYRYVPQDHPHIVRTFSIQQHKE